MKNLFLIRHAKSSWDFPLSDIDRPISQRGIQDALLVSVAMQNILPKKFIVWSSIARRTKETSYIFAQNLVFPIENIIFREDLYTFDYKDLLQSIQSCEDRIDTIILFGHNDAITKFVNKFGNRNIDNVPTSGVVQISFQEQKWSDISKGTTLHMLFPKSIRAENKNEYIH